MEVNLKLNKKMGISGINDLGLETMFDTHIPEGGENLAPTPMEIMLESLGACSMMDIAAIIRKKRKQITNLEANIIAERAEQHPKVFTKVYVKYRLTSPDAEIKDLERAVELSQTTYCSVSAMFQRSGCEVKWDCELING
ncbi:MAG TPA: OsmC family protein [Candidatus Kapabacteria bacterium]|nr:OsmC family protein [Candidatus Kapabacteria bacterium]HPO63462.1 OsmC family protein [Candidatus Kapabacteria bacterium]